MDTHLAMGPRVALFMCMVLIVVIAVGCGNTNDTGLVAVVRQILPTPPPTQTPIVGGQMLGSGGGNGGGGGGGVRSGTGSLYLGDAVAHKILRFLPTDTGNVTPLAAITDLDNTGIDPVSLAVNTSTGTLFVLQKVRAKVFAVPGAFMLIGNQQINTPLQIDITNGGALVGDTSIAYDTRDDVLFVTFETTGSVATFKGFSAISVSTPTPTAVVTKGQLAGASACFYNPVTDRLVVACKAVGSQAERIVVFDTASTLSSSSSSRVIMGAATGLNVPEAVAADSSGNVAAGNNGAASGSRTITVYANGESSSSVSMATQTAPQSTTLVGRARQFASDGSTLYVADSASPGALSFKFTSLISGSFAPATSIAGASTQIQAPLSIAIDPTH